jgi:hypothetical protein
MLRKLSIALSGALLMSGVAVAAQDTFPSSVNETASYGPAAGTRVNTPFWLRFGAGAAAPSQVDETHPAHTAGQRMPSMEGARGATAAGASSRAVPEPSSVDDAHPGHTGGQSMPSMGHGR